MTCLEVQELLSAFIDNELDEDTMKKIQKHIDICPACKKDVDELKSIIDGLTSIDDVPVPEVFNERLKEALAVEGQKIRNSQIIPITKKNKINWKRVSSIAAVFIVGLFSVILYNNNLDEFNKEGLNYSSYMTEDAIEENKNTNNLTINENVEGVEGIEDKQNKNIEYNKIEINSLKLNEENKDNSSKAIEENKDNLVKNSNETSERLQSTDEHLQSVPEQTQIQYDDSKNQSVDGESSDLETRLKKEQNVQPNVLFNSNEEYQTPEAISIQAEDEVLNSYFKQLEKLLDKNSYLINSYNKDEENVWTFNITIITTDSEGKEKEENVVYYGQDGTIWKKEL